MEDLADGPIEVTVEDVKVSLGIDPWGEVVARLAEGPGVVVAGLASPREAGDNYAASGSFNCR